MAFALAEGLVNALVMYIEANLAAKLTALDTEYGDSITLEMTKKTYKGIKSLTLVENYPALYVVSPTQEIDPWEVHSDGATIKTKPQAYIGILILDPNQEDLQLRLYRYARAIVELLIEGMPAGGLDGWDLVGEFEIDSATSPLPTTKESEEAPYIGEVSVGVTGQKTETK